MKKYISFLFLSILGLVTLVSAQTVSNIAPQSTRDFCSFITAPIAYKSQNQSVTYLQRFLQEQYAYKVSATGYYGPVTYGYIMRIQRALGIVGPTGSLGPVTLAKLRSIWCTNTSIPPNTTQSGLPTISLNPISSSGNTVTIGWNVQNATSCTLNGSTVNNVNGTQNFSIYTETTYTMSCANAQGQSSQSSIVVRPGSVTNNGTQPAVSIYATPNTFSVGQTVMIVWSSTNATSCTLNGQVVATSGAQQVVVGANASYTIACSGNGYTANQTLSASGVTTTCPAGSVSVKGQCTYQNVCTAEAGLCPNGQMMPRDPNCTWRADLCTTSATTSPSVIGGSNLVVNSKTGNINAATASGLLISLALNNCTAGRIDWGDGSSTNYMNEGTGCNFSHTYKSIDTYTVQVYDMTQRLIGSASITLR